MSISNSMDTESKHSYNKLLETMHEFVAELLPDGLFRYVSKILADDSGYKPEELVGTNFFSYIHPDDTSETLHHCEGLVKKGTSIRNCEYRFRKKDGSYIHIITNGEPLYDLEGHLEAILQVSFNITQRKKVERTLRESEEKYRILFENSLEGLFLFKEVFIDCNEQACRLLDCKREDIIGHDVLASMLPSQPGGRHSAETAQKYITAAFSGEPKVFSWQHRKKGGEQIDTEISLKKMIVEGEALLLATVRDITEQKRAEDELKRHQDHLSTLVKTRTAELSAKNQELSRSKEALVSLLEDVNHSRDELEKANIRLEELDDLKSMFIASMSHELRTPLNSIIGFTGIILQGMSGEINADQQDQLKRVYGSALHLLELITEIIDLSKIEAGKLAPYLQEFSLNELINEAVTGLKYQIKEKGLGIETDMPHDIHLKSDRTRLLQCLLNYLSNAMKFTERGMISIFAKEVGKMLEISVKDTGTGIKEADLPLLFTPFTRVDTSIKPTPLGTGLGLYLTKKLATEVLGGSVAVESQFGNGSTFILKIPLNAEVQGLRFSLKNTNDPKL